MSRQRLNWELIVAQLHPSPDQTRADPPHGFATLVVGRWRAARGDEALRRWAGWSLRTALASVAACALLAFLQNRHVGSILVPLPEPPVLNHLPLPQ
jgi:hypothetical protein